MIYILYSGDYEVFLGGNYRPEREVLIETTERVFDSFHSMGVPTTLFADVCCLWRYREHGFDVFPREVDEQLRDAVRLGHDVQAHIHPHWPGTTIQRDSQHCTNYEYDPNSFVLGRHSGDVHQISLDFLQRAKTYLTDLLRPIDSQYSCVAFRAGAYGVQPKSKPIFAALQEAGFLIDSSIVPGLQRVDGCVPIDFTVVPDKGNYFISPELGLSVAARQGVYEIPIAATHLNGLCSRTRAIFASIRRHLHKSPDYLRVGYPVGDKVPQGNIPFHRRVHRLLFSPPFRQLELSDDVSEMVELTKQYIKQRSSHDTDLYFSFGFHPKDLLPSRVEALKKYHTKLTRQYGSKLKAITFQEAARSVKWEQV